MVRCEKCGREVANKGSLSRHQGSMSCQAGENILEMQRDGRKLMKDQYLGRYILAHWDTDLVFSSFTKFTERSLALEATLSSQCWVKKEYRTMTEVIHDSVGYPKGERALRLLKTFFSLPLQEQENMMALLENNEPAFLERLYEATSKKVE